MRHADGAVRAVNCGTGIGHLHELAEGGTPFTAGRRRPDVIELPTDYTATWRERFDSTSDRDLAPHAEALGVTVAALREIGTCVSPRYHGALLFPMRRRVGGPVLGIRVRLGDGRKFCVTRSQNGLFTPAELGPDPVLAVEGPTDTAALLSIGVAAIGRPNASARADWLAKVLAGRRAVIVADRDGPGRDGAHLVAEVVARRAASCVVIEPPDGFKDVREAVRAGCTAVDMERLVLAAEGAATT